MTANDDDPKGGFDMSATSECKGCGKVFDSREAKCPHCGMKVKKPLYKSRIFWLIVGIVLVIGLLKTVFFSDLMDLLFG
jgi:hypothetical protein